jgi:aspartate dehydrogenase
MSEVIRVGLIGYGSIGRAIVDAWPRLVSKDFQLVAVLARPKRLQTSSQQAASPVRFVQEFDHFTAARPQVVIEAAGHSAVIDYAESLLSLGCEFHILSVGALAEDDLRNRLLKRAERSGGKIVIPSGALAGLDGLRSMRASGLKRVKYTSTKPVNAWRATAAERHLNLDALQCPCAFFQGSAREAARSYPRNANLAAAVAFAGIGLDQTEVELVADPATTANKARLQAWSATTELDVTLTGAALSGNPKSSRITAMSTIATLNNSEAQMGWA